MALVLEQNIRSITLRHGFRIMYHVLNKPESETAKHGIGEKSDFCIMYPTDAGMFIQEDAWHFGAY